MKCFAVQSKLVGTAVLMLVSLPLPLFAQSAAAPAPLSSNISPVPALAPVAPPVALPELSLPTVAVPETSSSPVPLTPESALPAVTSTASVPTNAAAGQAATSDSVVDALPSPKVYSFGDSNLSILFLPDQISRMKDSIRTFEDTGKDAEKPAPVPDVLAAPVAPEVIEDPLNYPVFYLASIAYENARDWSVWVSGYKITSRRNYTDITVLNVTRDSVTFLWKPSFMKAITKREKEKRFASIDPVKHKLVPSQSVRIDPEAGSIVFTLKPNQSFAPGYFKTFEGYIDGPTLTALPVVVAGAGNPNQPASAQTANQPLDGNANPIDNGQNVNGTSSFDSPSTNFNPTPRQ